MPGEVTDTLRLRLEGQSRLSRDAARFTVRLATNVVHSGILIVYLVYTESTAVWRWSDAMELPGLRTVRQQRLLTQAELAVRIGMTRASIVRLETGATKARISTVRKLAVALDASVEELRGELQPQRGRRKST